MKTLNQIYNLVFEKHMDRVAKFIHISPAICSSIQECYDDGKITLQEATLVTDHLNSQRPTHSVNPEFLTSCYRFSTTDKNYWWNDIVNHHAECTTQRILFLSKMIKITKEESLKNRVINFITNKKK